MAYAVKVETFEGPLDLLLELIEHEQLDVSLVSLARVTDQYITHLHERPDIPLEELTDFLVVASKLLFIKSKILLPFMQVGEDEGADLESQLKIYKEYLEASKVMQTMIGKRRFLFVHEKLPHVDIGFAPPDKFTGETMVGFMRALVARLEPVVHIPKAIIEKTVSIHEKIKQIQSMFDKASRLSFKTILLSAESRTEIIVSFLALLELVKQRGVAVSQGEKFSDITIHKMDAATA